MTRNKKTKKIVILDGYTTNPGDLSWAALKEFGELIVYDWTEQDKVVPRLQGATMALTNKVVINSEQMSKLPDLKYIGIMATGYDTIDVKAAKERNIIISNVPEYANYSVAQLTFAHILEFCYGIEMHTRSIVKDRYWCKQTHNSYWLKPLTSLKDKKIGIIGLGKVGERVADIANAFKMEVLGYDICKKPIENVQWRDLEGLLKESDFVTIHCPLLDSTRGLINKNTLSLMKSTAFLINTSRGQIVIDSDLAEALNDEIIAGAGLDVLENEPPEPSNPLLTAKNLNLTPHIGWATKESRATLINEMVLNCKAFIKGESRNEIGI